MSASTRGSPLRYLPIDCRDPYQIISFLLRYNLPKEYSSQARAHQQQTAALGPADLVMCLEQVKEGCGNTPTRSFSIVERDKEWLCLNGEAIQLHQCPALLMDVMENIPGDKLHFGSSWNGQPGYLLVFQGA